MIFVRAIGAATNPAAVRGVDGNGSIITVASHGWRSRFRYERKASRQVVRSNAGAPLTFAATVIIGWRRLSCVRHNSSGIRRQGFGPSPPAAATPEIVDVKDELDNSSEIINGILERIATDGVPLWNQPLEYLATPKHSFLVQSGLFKNVTSRDPAHVLVKALQALGADDDRAEVGAAVLCLMLGGLDEAQNLAMPHAWAAPTTYGGQPKPKSTMRAEASYCKVIVHRMEGSNRGEAGKGFEHSEFWRNKAFPSDTHEIFAALRTSAENLVCDCGDARSMLRTMGRCWNPQLFNRLCQEAVEFEEEDVLGFCKALQARELQLLLEHVVQGPIWK